MKVPNANANLTRAATFDEFVHEIRRERISHVLFMASYAVPWKCRILESTLDVIRHYSDFPEGTRNWDDHVYHPDHNGVSRPISQLWPGDGRAPVFARYVLGAVRLLGRGPLSSGLRLAWNDRGGLRTALSNQEALGCAITLLPFLPKTAWLLSGQNSWNINVTESYVMSSLQLSKSSPVVRSTIG